MDRREMVKVLLISFFFHFPHIQEQKNIKRNVHVQSAPKKSKMIKNKASTNASHLLLSYISILSREMSRGRGEKQNKKKSIGLV
jgi:hypothetical protein